VRELANALERGLILADGAPITAAHLGLEAGHPAPASTPTTLEEFERAAIVFTLSTVNGNRREAAQRLGIGLRTLYEKLKRYGIE
jgi:two-component system response regulator AtoC